MLLLKDLSVSTVFDIYYVLAITSFGVIGVIVASILVSFKLVREVIQPLQVLNSKMTEILSHSGLNNMELTSGEDNTSKELTELYQAFNALLRDRRF